DAYRETLSDEALYYVADLDSVVTNPDGTFTQNDPPGYPCGTVRQGTIDRANGRFDVTLTIPDGYYLRSIEDSGRISFDAAGLTRSADYLETRTFSAGEQRFSISFTISGNQLTLHARDLDLGTLFDGTATVFSDHLTVSETHF